MPLHFIALIVVVAWLVVFTLLQLEHARWSKIDFRLRYVMGMGTVCLGCLIAGAILGNPLLAVVPGLLATAGLGVLKSYADEEKAERGQAAAQQRGELVGRAKTLRDVLTQEMTDRGDDPTRN
jgi:hypothetical protein